MRPTIAGLLAALLASSALLAPSAAGAQGQLMFTTRGVSDKPQSKLWYNDGFWWCCINNLSKMAIYKLENNTWTSKVELQNSVTPSLKGGTSDVLWTGTNLFVAVFETSSTKIYKLSYNSTTKTYTLLTGFPVSITMPLGAETAVIDRDSSGRLWMTLEANTNIYVTYTTSADHRTWAALQSIGGPVDPDDISTIVAFGGNKIGVLWTDQRGHRVCFRWRQDTDAVASWRTLEVVRSGYGVVDDHLNMKADGTGRIYFAAKDYYDAVWIGRRDTNGTWTVTTGASGLDCGTRPILQIAPQDNKLYVFYTRWAQCVSTGTHAIEERVSSLDNLLFSLPTVVIGNNSVVMNEVQGTKQLLPAGSLAIICEGNNNVYWCGWGPISNIGGSDPGGFIPPPPIAPGSLTAQRVTESATNELALWRMDETGNTISDASGNGRVLTLAAGASMPHSAPGVVGNSLYFDGDDYATAIGTPFNMINRSFTLEAWVKIDHTNSSGTGAILTRADTLQANFDFTVTGNRVEMAWTVDDTTDVSIKADGTLMDKAWHHIAGVYDRTSQQARIYIDGTARAVKTIPGPQRNGPWPLSVGGIETPVGLDKQFHGWIDLACIREGAAYNGAFVPPILYPSTSTSYARLTWTASNSLAGIAGYRLTRSTNGGAALDLPSALTPTCWFADLTPPDGWLQYGVRAVDGLTQQGEPGNVQLAWESNPPAVPSAPGGLAWTTGHATIEGPAFWELDEGSGQSSADGTGLGHTARLGGSPAADSGDPAWVWGLNGKALRFDGDNDYVRIEDASDIRFSSSFTVEAWVRRTRLGSTQGILSKDSGSQRRNYSLHFTSNGSIEFSWSRTSGSTRRVTSSISVTDLEWHHVAGVYDANNGTSTIWIDGVQRGSASTSGTPYTGSEALLIGARNAAAPTEWLEADIDLVRLSNFRRYTAPFEPAELYRGGAQRNVLLLDWQLPATGLVQAYNVYRQNLPSGSNTRIGTVPVAAPQFTDLNVTHNAAYRYTIRALNSGDDEGPASPPLDVTVPLPTDADSPPGAPGPRLAVEPNPFNPQASVRFRIDATGPVQLDLYDVRGRRVDTLVAGNLPAGDHRVPLVRPGSGLRLVSGVYFLRLRADGREMRIKAVLLK